MDEQAGIKELKGRFPGFGPNKLREIHRLLAEIEKREPHEAGTLVDRLPADASFVQVKEMLLKRRYPDLTRRGIRVRETFPAFDADPANRVSWETTGRFDPQVICVEKGEESSVLAQRFFSLFPRARREVIESLKAYAGGKRLSAGDYNRRCEKVFIVREKFDFFKACPCSPGVVGCGYHNANLGMGCPFECSYCFLQNYTNTPGIIFPSNLDDFFQAFTDYKKGIRLGSGEMTDSLAFDHLTEFSPRIVEAFRRYPGSLFEFKTKSANVDLLLSVPASSNIVVAWSLNPPGIIEAEEHGTASLQERLQAAGRCAAHGYRTAFHFDPILYYEGWKDDYHAVVSELFRAVPKETIAWISLGTLRMTKEQKKMIENRFPETTILNAELLTAPDGKIRYHDLVRREIYAWMMSCISEYSSATSVYLCMEPPAMWRSLDLKWKD